MAWRIIGGEPTHGHPASLLHPKQRHQCPVAGLGILGFGRAVPKQELDVVAAGGHGCWFEHVANPFLPIYGPTPADDWQPPEHIVLMEVPVTEGFEIAGHHFQQVLGGEAIALFKRQSDPLQ